MSVNNVWQQALALDAKYNAYRAANNANFRSLYLRRRSQLLRETAKDDVNAATARKQYLKIRNQLLAQRYGQTFTVDEKGNTRSRSLGARSSSRSNTLDSSYCGDSSWEGRYLKGAGRRAGSVSQDGDRSQEGTYQKKEATPTTSIKSGENYAFSGVHHIFDQHKGAVTAVSFANNDKSLLACSSMDGTLSVCQVTPKPATVLYVLRGHRQGVTRLEWSLSNELLLSSSLDGTVRLWDAASGKSLRSVNDQAKMPILCCAFQPLNNNMVVTGNLGGLVQVLNISTGIYFKGGSAKASGSVLCLSFEPTGRILWAGDNQGHITSFILELSSGKLSKARRMRVCDYATSVTCLSARNWGGLDGKEPSLLVNCSANVLLLFNVCDAEGKIVGKRRFPLKHRSRHSMIRSSFCPIMSFRHGTYVVSGSEDTCVYFFNLEGERQSCVNKLQGHGAAVLDVAFNYDESLLASSDANGLVIVWKREPT